MKIEVRVQPNSTQERAEYAGGKLKVWLKSKPVEGEANKSLIKFLKKQVKSVTGTNPQINIIKGSKPSA